MAKIAAVLLLAAFVAVKADDVGPNAPVPLGVLYLKVCNQAESDVIDTRISGTKAQEWGSSNAPQYNFQNVPIPSGDCVQREVDVNLNAEASHFTMELIYVDQTSEKFTMNLQWPFDGSPDFEHLEGKRNIRLEKSADHTLVITIRD